MHELTKDNTYTNQETENLTNNGRLKGDLPCESGICNKHVPLLQ